MALVITAVGHFERRKTIIFIFVFSFISVKNKRLIVKVHLVLSLNLVKLGITTIFMVQFFYNTLKSV